METDKQKEERKRDLACDPRKRWEQIQEMITWAEANMPPEQRRNRPRTRPNVADATEDSRNAG